MRIISGVTTALDDLVRKSLTCINEVSEVRLHPKANAFWPQSSHMTAAPDDDSGAGH